MSSGRLIRPWADAPAVIRATTARARATGVFIVVDWPEQEDRAMAKPGRNDACPCGSGRKYKKCCEAKTSSARSSRVLMLVVGASVVAAIAVAVASFTSERGASSVRVWDPAHGHYHDANGVQVP